VDGQRLKADSERFRAKLNADALFERWVRETEARSLEVAGRVLDVRRRGGAALALDIHFADHLITLFKEVRNLTWLGFRVPYSIVQPAERAKVVYPLAVSLRETLRAYDSANARLAAEPAADAAHMLVAAHKLATQTLIAEVCVRARARVMCGVCTQGFKLRWSTLPKVNTYVPRLVAGEVLWCDRAHAGDARHLR
jgi:dynein heavy chain 1